MSFDLCENQKTDAEDAFQNDIGHEDLFDTINEVHYLPELSGPHDEALLESLVEKGCEDNQILGQALDKLAHLVHESGEYPEEEEDMLLGNAPVADIIDRLEQSLESPSRSSMTAAQGLLHLHHIGDHLTSQEHQQSIDQTYLNNDVFNTETPVECSLQTLNAASELQESCRDKTLGYDQNAEKMLQNDVDAADAMFAEQVPDLPESYQSKTYETPQTLPDPTVVADCSPTLNDNNIVIDSVMPNIVEENNQPIEQMDDHSHVIDEFIKEESSNSDKHIDNDTICEMVEKVSETMDDGIEDVSDVSDKSNDEQPKDLSVHRRFPTPHASPRRIDIPRAPSRESDAMQSPQPSGIPAVPSSPEIFSMPMTKSKQTLFLETLLSSPSPKMYTSEVTITKQQCEPLNLGKHRKSASPTVTSCSDEIKSINKDYGEPKQKKKRETDIVKITKIFNSKCSDEQTDCSPKLTDTSITKPSEDFSPAKQLEMLKTCREFSLPDPLLIPKDKFNDILAAPGKEIPALLIHRPELRIPTAFAFPAILQDPDILVVSLSQLENILNNDNHQMRELASPKPKEIKVKPIKTPSTPTSTETVTPSQTQPDQTSQRPKSATTSTTDSLAIGDIDSATAASAALNPMFWYFSQLEAMAAAQNMDLLKALNSSGYSGSNYPDLSQMFNPAAMSNRMMNPTGFPMMPPMDYESRIQFALWQEAMNQANTTAAQRSKPNNPMEAQMKELASKSSDVQNPFVHSTKNHQSKSHSSARTSPITPNYNSGQRSMAHSPYLQNMYPGMNPNIRHNMPLPGLQIPYFDPRMMGSQRSPRTGQQKSPTSPYYPNNNYLHSLKQSETHRSGGSGQMETQRPRISVRSLQNLLEPAAVSGQSGSRRASHPAMPLGRRREEPEVGSTTPLGEQPPHLPPPHPHDPASFHLWHPLFGNQKSYNSPWSWTTVTATGD